jgi:anti-sigma regulatory factor (Ser/Thr protein kinase)
MSFEVRQRFQHGPLAPAHARQALDAVLSSRVDTEALGELRLMVSELVTNAVRHGRSRRGLLELSVAMDERTVRLEVSDGGAGFIPPGRVPGLGEAGGWGLVLVDRLADRWGVDADPQTRVWAERRLVPPPVPTV